MVLFLGVCFVAFAPYCCLIPISFGMAFCLSLEASWRAIFRKSDQPQLAPLEALQILSNWPASCSDVPGRMNHHFR